MRLVLGSDLHGFLPEDIPCCDILIIAGDILPDYNQADFMLKNLPPWVEMAKSKATHVIATWGNHDWLSFSGIVPKLDWNILVEEAITIEGLKIYGSPWSLPFRKWAWMAPEKTLKRIYATIPEDTDILISHAPPLCICDRTESGEHVGSLALKNRISELKNLKLVVCGHIHEARGRKGNVINASCLTANYQLRQNPWMVISL